jgi:hypothetical protein
MALGILTKQQILETLHYKFPRFCVSPEIWNLPRKVNTNPFANWIEVKFEAANINHFVKNNLDGQQGIYMFVVKPHEQHSIHHSYIMYVGETSNLKQRFEQYFTYETATEPSDQLKRRMVIVWEKFLYFFYIKTNFPTKAAREEQEYDLIDSIIPPINDKFRSRVVKRMKKNLKDV